MALHVFPASDALTVRAFTRADAGATRQVFRHAVRVGAANCYSEAERIAWWGGSVVTDADWRMAREAQPTWVAERRGEVVGFVDLKSDGEVNMLYVHPDHTRRGIGSALLDEVEQSARGADMMRLHARVSLVAEPVFARAGFLVVRRQWAERDGERLAQAVMEKVLEPAI